MTINGHDRKNRLADKHMYLNYVVGIVADGLGGNFILSTAWKESLVVPVRYNLDHYKQW